MSERPADTVSFPAGPDADTILNKISPQTQGAATLLRAWCLWRGRALLPTRHDMHVPDIVSILPAVAILEVRSSTEVIVRLAGTGLCAAVGQDLTGRNWLTWSSPEVRATRAQRVLHMVNQPCGGLMHGTYQSSVGMTFRAESITLPVRPARPQDPMQLITAFILVPGQPRPNNVPQSVIGQLPEQFRFFDVGASVPHG